MTPEQRLREQAAIARYNRQQGIAERQLDESARQQYSALLVSFNADIGAWLCRLPDGSTTYARTISPVAGMGVGDVVSLYAPGQGMAIIDSW
jgi:hypothetical protein